MPSAAGKTATPFEAAMNWAGALPAPDSAGMSLVAAQFARAALLSMHMAEATLHASRRMLDASRAVLRQQQDAAMQAWRDQLEAASASAGDAERFDMFAPFAAAAQAAAELNGALVRAQRGLAQSMSDRPEASPSETSQRR